MKILSFNIFGLCLIISLFVSITASAHDQNNYNQIQQTYSCNILNEFLYDCEKFRCRTSIPELYAEISQEIKGLDEEGNCVHEQETPEGDTVFCKYSEESRKFLSLSIAKNKADAFGLSEPSAKEKFFLNEIFNN